MKTTDLLQVLQTVLLAAIVAFLAVRDEPAAAGEGLPDVVTDEPAWSRVGESLDRLAVVLGQSVVGSAAGIGSTNSERRQSIAEGHPPDLDPLVAQLQRLETVLKGVRGVVDRTPAVVSMRDRYAKAEWSKLKPLYRRYVQMSEENKESEFKREFLLISLADVLRRFGKPTSIETEASGQSWQYYLEDEKGDETVVDLTFEINNGFVVNIH